MRFWSFEDISFAVGAFGDSEAEVRWDERLDAVKEEVVELGPRLAADFDGVFEAFRCDQRNASAFPLQDCVRDLANGFGDRLRRVGRGGENFQKANTAALDPDAVGEGAAGVDSDAEGGRLGHAGPKLG